MTAALSPTCTPTNAPTPARSGRTPAWTARHLPGSQQPYLDYHIALTLGWPIATGVIEGSCRLLVKDRLDVTGAGLAHVFSAAAINLHRIDAHLTGRPTGTTRHTHFADLDLNPQPHKKTRPCHK